MVSQDTAKRGNHVPYAYVDICGGYDSDAKVFSQIMYWHQPNEDLEGRLTIRDADGDWWLAKNHKDWFAETRIKIQTVRKVLVRLRDEHHLIYTRLSGFNGESTPYIRINWQEFERRIKLWVNEKGAAITESVYKTFLKKLETPAPLVEVYLAIQKRYLELSSESLPPHAIKEQPPVKKSQAPDPFYHPTLIDWNNPLLKRIDPNTESPSETTDQRLSETKGRESHAAHTNKSLPNRMLASKERRQRHSKPAAIPTRPPLSPVPPPPLPNTGAGKGFDIHTDPLWLAFKKRWHDLTSTKLPIPKNRIGAYAESAQRMHELGVTPGQVEKLVDQWITQEHFDYPFAWAADRIHTILSAENVKRRGQTFDDSSDDLSSIESCDRIIADENIQEWRRDLARKHRAQLVEAAGIDYQPPDDFWPARPSGMTIGGYFTHRRELWAAICESGYAENYVHSTEPDWLSEDIAEASA